MKRTFNLGSEWLYFKIYCGVKSADFILVDYLKETIAQLLAQKHISKWFFIRYNDPESHLRLRFKIDNPENLGKVITTLHPIFETLQQQNLVWKIQTDTYVRELERYGSNTYEISESIFQADSELILEYIALKPYFENDSISILFSFLAVDQFLSLFSLTSEDKYQLLDRMQLSFKNEFQADKTLKKELDKHYREMEKSIFSFLHWEENELFIPLYEAILDKTKKIKEDIALLEKNLEVNLFSCLNSHIHMLLNRQFTSRQREYELLIYDHLYRYYKANYFKEVVVNTH